jgi:hypothetical protein
VEEGSAGEEEGEGLFVSRACLRSLKDVGLVGGVGEDADGDEVDGVSVRVATGFIRSSEVDGGIVFALTSVGGVGLTVPAGVLEELVVAVETDGGAEVSTILMGTRRRFGAVTKELVIFGSGESADGFEPRGGEATSIGVRFYDTRILTMVQCRTSIHDIPCLCFPHDTLAEPQPSRVLAWQQSSQDPVPVFS